MVYVGLVQQALRPEIAVAVQNCYAAAKGAFTGEIRLVAQWMMTF